MSLCRYDTTQECNKTYTRGCLDCILDKIRADIESMDFDFGDYYDHTETIQEMVLGVIDKYRKETE